VDASDDRAATTTEYREQSARSPEIVSGNQLSPCRLLVTMTWHGELHAQKLDRANREASATDGVVPIEVGKAVQ
jgi:hypothetical protein